MYEEIQKKSQNCLDSYFCTSSYFYDWFFISAGFCRILVQMRLFIIILISVGVLGASFFLSIPAFKEMQRSKAIENWSSAQEATLERCKQNIRVLYIKLGVAQLSRFNDFCQNPAKADFEHMRALTAACLGSQTSRPVYHRYCSTATARSCSPSAPYIACTAGSGAR